MKTPEEVSDTKNGHSVYFQPNIFGLIEKISSHIRKRMFVTLMEVMQPSAETTILDVGVGSEERKDGNFFEKFYPYPSKITALGTENAAFLEKKIPGLKFISADGRNLPFPDKSFDLVVSFATIEHVGNRDQQRKFIHEVCRVGKSTCLITPNRWYPIEFHTVLPLVHWLPSAWFRFFARCLGKEFFAKEENLNLLSERDALNMFPKNVKVHTKHFRLFGLISNLMFYVKD